MPDLRDGESVEMQGSGSKPYVLKNVGGVYSCSCPAWLNQSLPIERRTCKHLIRLRGQAVEQARLGADVPRPTPAILPTVAPPPLLLADSWDSVMDPTGWLMSEKLDGVRGYWDGKQFWSRLGHRFYAPDWFVAGLPAIPLDGELWLGRKQFQRTVSIIRRQDESELWQEVSYRVFDAPALDKDFESRLALVANCLRAHPCPQVQLHPHERCQSLQHLRQELNRIEALGGEGLMLRQAGSRYESGRSATLLKVKRFHDAEARVVKHLPGAGRHKGRMGALLVEMPNGTQFSVGTGFSDRQREHPPAISSLITYRYQELTDAGVPRFPSFVRLRAGSPESTAPPPTPTGGPTMSVTTTPTTRRFEFSEGNSNKYWQITVEGTGVTVQFGRIGSTGQTQQKSFADATAAAQHAEKLIGEKMRKGYRPVS
jgi:DNA ligase-1